MNKTVNTQIALPQSIQVTRRLLPWAGALLFVFSVPLSIRANQISITIKNNTGEDAGDLHIVLKGGGTITKMTGGFADENFVPGQGLGKGDVDLSFGLGTADTVPKGGSHKFTMEFKNYEGITSAAWTDIAGSDIPTPINIGTDISLSMAPLPNGLIRVFDVITDPSLADPLTISNFAFATNVSNFDLFTNDPSSLSFSTPISFVVTPGSQILIPVGDLIPGTFVVAKGTGQIGNEAPYSFISNSQVIPEPSSLLLLVTGTLGLLGYRWRLRRRRQRDTKFFLA